MKRHLFKLALFLLLGAIVNVAVAWGCANWHGNNPTLSNLFSEVLDAEGFDKVREEVNDIEFPNDFYISIELEEQGDWLSLTRMETQSYASGENWQELREDIPDSHLLAVALIGTGIEKHIVFNGRLGRPMPPSDEWPGSTWTSFMGRVSWVNITVGFPLKSLFYTPSNSMPDPLNQQPQEEKVWHLPNVFGKMLPSSDELLLPYGMLWLGFTINTVFYAVIVWILWSSPFAVRRFMRRKRGHCIKCGYDLRHVGHEKCPECGVKVVE